MSEPFTNTVLMSKHNLHQNIMRNLQGFECHYGVQEKCDGNEQ